MLDVDKSEFVKICDESISMAQACSKLNMHFNTFKRYALKFDCYTPNQGGKGMSKPSPHTKIPTNEILEGRHPQYQTYKLKNRLISEGVFNNVCFECGLTEWNGKELVMELDHINGDPTDHRKDNLRMLCPNCHAQTPTHRGLNAVKR